MFRSSSTIASEAGIVKAYRILIVDDEPLIARNLQVFLEDEGMHAQSVYSGEKALELTRDQDSFDVCIMDMRLPGLDGHASIRGLRKICPHLKFIICTGSSEYTFPNDLGIEEISVFRKPLLDMTPLAAKVRRLASQDG